MTPSKKALRALRPVSGPKTIYGYGVCFSELEDSYIETSRSCYIVLHTVGGDYAGSPVERSNFLAMKEAFPRELVKLYGSHGAYGLLVPGDDISEELNEALESLVDYCVFDDDELLRLESRLVDEAWENYGRNDFSDALRNRGVAFEDSQGVDALWQKHGGHDGTAIELGCVVYFPVDRIAGVIDEPRMWPLAARCD